MGKGKGKRNGQIGRPRLPSTGKVDIGKEHEDKAIFKLDAPVLAHYRTHLYKAKVVRLRLNKTGEIEYYLKYHGFGSNWNEWRQLKDLKECTPENMDEMKRLRKLAEEADAAAAAAAAEARSSAASDTADGMAAKPRGRPRKSNSSPSKRKHSDAPNDKEAENQPESKKTKQTSSRRRKSDKSSDPSTPAPESQAEKKSSAASIVSKKLTEAERKKGSVGVVSKKLTEAEEKQAEYRLRLATRTPTIQIQQRLLSVWQFSAATKTMLAEIDLLIHEENMVYCLPAKPCIKECMDSFVESLPSKTQPQARGLINCLENLFEACLPTRLLYQWERQQLFRFLHSDQGKMPLSKVYSIHHLLRFVGMLPSLLAVAYTTSSEFLTDEQIFLVRQLLDFTEQLEEKQRPKMQNLTPADLRECSFSGL